MTDEQLNNMFTISKEEEANMDAFLARLKITLKMIKIIASEYDIKNYDEKYQKIFNDIKTRCIRLNKIVVKLFEDHKSTVSTILSTYIENLSTPKYIKYEKYQELQDKNIKLQQALDNKKSL